MDTTQIIIAVGLTIVILAVLSVYGLWLRNRHKHPTKTTVD